MAEAKKVPPPPKAENLVKDLKVDLTGESKSKTVEEDSGPKVEVNVASPEIQVLSDVSVENAIFAEPAETDDKGLKG